MPIQNEVWVKGDTKSIVMEMLKAIGKEHNLDIWYNGIQIWKAVPEALQSREQDHHRTDS
jgi:hypothetical protein